MEITLKTLTPLWTGGTDQTADRLHETGLLGSLRWWYEALVRGLGGYACDPTEQSCIYDTNKPYNGLCVACQMFGATGWARRFRLVVQGATNSDGPFGMRQTTGLRFKKDNTQRPSWYFSKRQGRAGAAILSIVPLSRGFDPNVILGLLKLIERHTGLAAKTQLGYGWISITQSPDFDIAKFVQSLQTVATAQPSTSKGLPSVNEMFFAQISPADKGIDATLNLRYDVRAAFRNKFDGNTALRHFVCGSVKGNQRQASKIHFSQAVDGTMRVWGWIPEIPKDIAQVSREEVIAAIHETIQKFGKISSWREYNSARDKKVRTADPAAYLQSLLQEEK